MAKALSIQPLHGNLGDYIETLLVIREYVEEEQPSTKKDLKSWYVSEFETTIGNAEKNINSLFKCRLLTEGNDRIECAFPRGKNRDRKIIEIIDDNVVFILDMLNEARDGASGDELHLIGKSKYGLGRSSSKYEIQWRRGWLESAGMLESKDGTLYATDAGRKLLHEHEARFGGAGDEGAPLLSPEPSQPPVLNRILYGPPGTGKTFDARSDAVQIIDGGPPDDDRERVKAHFNKLRETGQIEFVTFHQNYAYEDFIEGIRPVLKKKELAYELRDGIFKKIAKRASKHPSDGYVLIIDEINRGNIAKIFGELITLIEPSKRLGRDDEAKARLPYSQKLFGVPPNLHLIGTMNTADRGILLLDAALRRRFEFVEKMPDASHIADDIEGVDGRALLTAINERIVENQDRDHQIGHTYLMGVETLSALARAFQAQIIPLLREYFYDDWEKMHNVLNGNAFVTKRGDTDRPVFAVLPHGDDKWQQAETYQAIYGGDRGGADDE